MSIPRSDERGGTFEPRHPTVVALGLCTIWIAILSLPMWSGRFLAGPLSDQYATGYAWRHWQAEQWKALGHIPLWNPDIFAGLPYVGAFHGDIFYPTAWLRLLLPTALAMDLGFVVHYVLAGFFLYLLLRRLEVSWTGAVVGAAGYQLSGVIGTYVQPGHDGKLFVTALLPLALLALVLAIRERRFQGYGLLALAVGLATLSPHPQMTEYMQIAAGLFTLYLVFGEPDGRKLENQLGDLGLALAAVLVGFLVGAIQLLPALHYIPFSPRAETYRGWEGATSFAIPWEHVPELFLSGFVGQSGTDTYWGSNDIKLHSEYLGLPLLALAVLGATGARRRLVLWLGGIGLLFLLVTLGASTPFYRLWYAVVPLVKQTRAPGMALYVVALVVSVLAGLGAQRLERGEGGRHVRVWLGVAGVVVLLAVLGGFGQIASFLATGVAELPRVSALGRNVVQTANHAHGAIMRGALASGVALAAVAALAWAGLRGRVKPVALSLGLALIVGADLWWNCHAFWTFSDASQIHGSDEVVESIQQTPRPYRVLNLGNGYPGATLMTHDIPQLLGHHGNELHRFDELMGGKNLWRNLFQSDLKLWRLFAIGHVIVPAGSELEGRLPGFSGRYRKVLDAATTRSGYQVDLFTAVDPPAYARLVPAAAELSDQQAIPTLLDPRFQIDRLILVDPSIGLDLPEITEVPDALPQEVSFTSWQIGSMELQIDPPADQDSYLLVSENWYPDWKAEVDGTPTQAIRGDVSLITVPVPAGARRVALHFESSDYRLGRLLTIGGVVLILLTMVVPSMLRRSVGV